MQSSSVFGKKKGMAPTQLFLPVSEIRDSLLVLKNGGVRAVLQVSSVNFNLKSEQEQKSLIYGYQGFLNLLEFPVQILARSKKLDIDAYADRFSHIAKNHTNLLLKEVTENYVEYIKKLVEYSDIMEKVFYVIIPYDPLRNRKRGAFTLLFDALSPQDSIQKIRQRKSEFESLKKGVMKRVDLVHTGLENIGLSSHQLETPGLTELLYQSFNPITSRNQKMIELENQMLLNV
jgi:hypothetical protein